MIISRGGRADAPALARVMYLSVRMGARRYSVAERAAWMPKPPNPARFAKRLAGQEVWVLRSSQGPLGFVGMTDGGYVDLAFLLPQAKGRGAFQMLMQRLGPQARTTHASLHAEPAFHRAGFRVVQRETVIRNGQRLRRAFMRRA